ncbi:MAG: DUF177 domain-containing protein [Pelovirga sp.]
MVQLELKHIKGGLLEQDYSCQVADFPEVAALARDGLASYREPILFHLRFQQTGRLVEVDGAVQATIDLTCARCLGPLVYELDERFTLTFAPLVPEPQDVEERELDKEELGLIPYSDDRLELRQPLEEQLLMAIPVRTLCDASCRGLCAQCGADLNRGQCACEQRPFNNKFGDLAKLRR